MKRANQYSVAAIVRQIKTSTDWLSHQGGARPIVERHGRAQHVKQTDRGLSIRLGDMSCVTWCLPKSIAAAVVAELNPRVINVNVRHVVNVAQGCLTHHIAPDDSSARMIAQDMQANVYAPIRTI